MDEIEVKKPPFWPLVGSAAAEASRAPACSRCSRSTA
jgi:hypothetical protein